MPCQRSVFGRVDLSPAWFSDALGLVSPHPLDTDIDDVAMFRAEKAKILAAHFPDLPLGNPESQPSYPVFQYDGRLIIASAFAEIEPVWDPATASFWVDKTAGPWRDIQTVADVRRIEVPDWGQLPLVKKMLANWAEARRRGTYPMDELSEWMESVWTNPYTGKKYHHGAFASFVDLGAFLCGSVEFFTILAGEPELAAAMQHKCFELSTSFSDFRRQVYGRKLEAISNFGGDNSCNLSPAMYRRYVMPYDQMLLDEYGDLPCNLHSCGPSQHLYETWADYPNLQNIVRMQTRGIPGQLHTLRKALPYTFLQITLHQPQCDFEEETPDRIRELVFSYAEEAEYENLELVVVINKAGEKVDVNIRAFYRSIDEVNMKAKCDDEC